MVQPARSRDNRLVRQRRGSDETSEEQLAALAAAIVKRRHAKKLTQEAASYEAGIALRTLQNIESGRLNPSYLTLRAVASALHTPLAKLIPD